MLNVGGSFLEKLLAVDRGYRGPLVDCEKGHQAKFVSYRDKGLDTVLGRVRLERAYYHCKECSQGVIPLDQDLDCEGLSLSPGVRRMVARAGSQEPFAPARRDLAELAGIEFTIKRVERAAKASGGVVKESGKQELEGVLEGKIVSCSTEEIETMYVGMDGTGVPVVARETEGRAGKGPDGRARTREVKLGCVFTQTTLDDHGYPIRDPESSSYLAVIEGAKHFGELLKAEALRRGVERAKRVIVIGDGATWIWNLAEAQFPDAFHVVDLYHAREHLHDLAKLVFPAAGEGRAKWARARIKELDAGDMDVLLRRLRASQPPACFQEDVDRAIGYFETNQDRMRYGDFRRRGLFVGSGVVEAGCKTIAHQRLKCSGMRWTVKGAEAILALRCREASGRWDEFWTLPHAQTQIA